MPNLASLAHDADLARLLACGNPITSKGLTAAQLRGSFQGIWEGRFSFFDFDSYRDVLAGRVRSLYEGPFRGQPQVWRIEETVMKLTPNDVEGGKG